MDGSKGEKRRTILDEELSSDDQGSLYSEDVKGEESGSGSGSGSEAEEEEEDVIQTRKKRRRHLDDKTERAAFSLAMNAILEGEDGGGGGGGTALVHVKGTPDPILSRKPELERRIEEDTVQEKAEAYLRAQKRKNETLGHVVPMRNPQTDSDARGLDVERKLRKIAQRGVVKLFNAVRASQRVREELNAQKGVVAVGREKAQAQEDRFLQAYAG